jgi:hypothetical protein
MFWLIETSEQFKNFTERTSTKLFVNPVWKHPEIHPGLSTPLCLYVKDIEIETSYLINIAHPEALKLNIDEIKQFFKTTDKHIYTPDRKAFNYFCFIQNSYDLNLDNEIKTRDNIQAINHYTARYAGDPNLNAIIPIVKHFEYNELIYQDYLKAIRGYKPSQYKQDLTSVFWFIERNALKTDGSIGEYFEVRRPFLSQSDDYIYTQYNLYTTTGRPSNTFNNINFAALNKENGCRNSIIPRNDFLVEIDLTAYHPTLISKMVGYQSPNGDIYEDFAHQYNLERAESKNLVFKQLYGHVYHEYQDFEFFKLTQKLIEKVWKKYTEEGKITITQSGKVFESSNLENMNPQKLFNYIIQHLETYTNTQLLKEILTVLNGKKTIVVLYVYDSILLDVSEEERQVVQEIQDIFEQNKLKIKVNYGKNYGTLQPL